MKLNFLKTNVNCFLFLILLAGILFASGCVQNAGENSSQGAVQPAQGVRPGTLGPQGLQIVLKDPGMPEVKYLQPNITEVQLQNKEGQWITIWSNTSGKTVKLTHDGAEMNLDTVSVPAGTYVGTRLKVSTIDVSVDVNRDGDTTDKNVEIVLTLDEFNSLPAKDKPSAPSSPQGQQSPEKPTPPEKPSAPSQPSAPEKPSKPQQSGFSGFASDIMSKSEKPSEPQQSGFSGFASDIMSKSEKPSEPSQPSEPTQPPEPTQPQQPAAGSQQGGQEPSTPYRIEGDLVYMPNYLDETHTVTLNDYIAPLGEEMWKTDLVYGGSGGELIYDFTLDPLAPKGEQITVNVSYLAAPPPPPMKVSSLSVSPDAVIGGAYSVGTVTLDGPAPEGGQVVQLSAAPKGSVLLPANITVPAGATSGTFNIVTPVVTSPVNVTVAAGIGDSRKTAQLTINPAPAPVLSAIAVSPASVVGGGVNAIGTVTLDGPAPAGGTVVTLGVSSPATAFLTPTVTVKAGGTSGSFNITTYRVGSPVTVTLMAMLNGVQKTTQLTINPVPALSALTVSPATVEGGGVNAIGTVNLTGPAPAGGQVVALSSNSNLAMPFSPTVTVKAGETSASFNITTYRVGSPVTVTIAASMNGVQKTAQFTVNPAPAVYALNVSPASVVGGTSSTGTVTLNVAAPAGGQIVVLSSNSNLLTFPPMVTVKAGETSGTFSIMTQPVNSPVIALMVATLQSSQSSQRTAQLTINPAPALSTFDVTINSLSCTWSVKTGAYGVKSDCVRIISNGTAKGPVGARLELPILAWSDDKIDCGAWTYKSGALIAVGGTCVRGATQPDSTAWKVDTEGNECPTKSYFSTSITHTPKIYKDSEVTPQDTDSRTAVCQ